MKTLHPISFALVISLLLAGGFVSAQEPAPESATPVERDSPLVNAGKKVGEGIEVADKKMAELAEREEVKDAAVTVIDWIEGLGVVYQPWMNCFLVAVGIALFISHGGQFLFGKLYLALRFRSLDVKEAFNDLLVTVFTGLALPAVLIIPVGHGAFIANPILVLASAGIGMLLGILLYGQGIKVETLAAKEKKDQKEKKKD